MRFLHMIYNETHQILAEGNMVLAVSEGTFGGGTQHPTMTSGELKMVKIAEHWDVIETIADKSTWQNQNGKF